MTAHDDVRKAVAAGRFRAHEKQNQPGPKLTYPFIPVPEWLYGGEAKGWSDGAARLFGFLVKLVPFGTDFDGYTLDSRYNQDYIAHALGRSRLHITRAFNELRECGAVTTKRGVRINALITLHDPFRSQK